MSLDEKVELALSVAVECIQPEELRNLLDKKPNPTAYDGFEPSGRMHIAQASQPSYRRAHLANMGRYQVHTNNITEGAFLRIEVLAGSDESIKCQQTHEMWCDL